MPRAAFPEFGQRLRALYAQREITNKSAFAKDHGWDAVKFGRWLAGSVPESRKDQDALARAFGVTWQYLLTGLSDGASIETESDGELRALLDEIGAEVSAALAARPNQRRNILSHLRGQVSLIRTLAEPETAPAQPSAATAPAGSLQREKTTGSGKARPPASGKTPGKTRTA